MTLFQNRYRIESARSPGWDYGSPGYYFVTVCTHNRAQIFGNIGDGAMQLNDHGKIVYDEWVKTIETRRELVRDEFVVMPDHFHGIVHIVPFGEPTGRVVARNVPTTTTTATTVVDPVMAAISPKPHSLSTIIRSFKSAVSKRIHAHGMADFKWQSRFHEHIVRNEQELYRIRQYIINNPVKWLNG